MLIAIPENTTNPAVFATVASLPLPFPSFSAGTRGVGMESFGDCIAGDED